MAGSRGLTVEEIRFLGRVINYLIEKRAPLVDARMVKDRGKPYIIVSLDTDADEAVQVWDKLLDDIDLEVPVFVTWTGRANVDVDRLASTLARMMAKTGLLLETDKPIDASRIE